MNGGHFKLGLFVTIAVALLVTFLLTLGVMDRFRPRLMIESYFSESVQGLQRGADVMFRGVKVGSVREIGFASSVYPEARHPEDKSIGGLIRVELAFDVKTLQRGEEAFDNAYMERAVDDGLRARLAVSGLGGPPFIDVNFLDSNRFPEMDIPWAPEYGVLPTAPSTVGSIVNSLADILREIDERDVIDHLANLSENLDSIFGDFEDSSLYATSESALRELRDASAEARELLADPRLDTILDDAGSTLKGARTLLEKDHGEIETLVKDLATMAGSLDTAARSLDTLASNVNESDLIDDLRGLAEDLGPAGKDLAVLATRLDRLISGNETQIADTIRSLRNAVDELKALLEDLKVNPGRLLSDPPPRRRPGGGP